jgi:alanine racemase
MQLIELLLPDMDKRELRTWVEIDKAVAQANVRIFRRLIGPKVFMWAVVKSNAYGHGLFVFPRLIEGGIDGFCVDTLIEGVKLREMGIKKPILVLGFTLPKLLPLAEKHDITVSVSSTEMLKRFLSAKAAPKFHLKVDTGMHRQGVFPEAVPAIIKALKAGKKEKFVAGVFTHFASGKDINYPTYTDAQLGSFLEVCGTLKKAGFKNLMRHASATAGAMVAPKYHLDAVRIGIGFYGLYPSKELEIQCPDIKLKPVLSWRTVVGETKSLRKGDYVGYDLVERVSRPTKIAVLPIGYWHGYPRALSSVGQVLIRGRRSKVLGRVSMDMIVVDVTGTPAKFGDVATLIGRDGKESVTAQEFAASAGASYYEILTRINPLIERVES